MSLQYELYSKLTLPEAIQLLIAKDEQLLQLRTEVGVYKEVVTTFALERASSPHPEPNTNRIIKRKHETIELSSSDGETDDEGEKGSAINPSEQPFRSEFTPPVIPKDFKDYFSTTPMVFPLVDAEVLQMRSKTERNSYIRERPKIKIENDPRQERINQEIIKNQGLPTDNCRALDIDDYGSMELHSRNKMKSQPCVRFLKDDWSRPLLNKYVALHGSKEENVDYTVTVLPYLNHTATPTMTCCKDCDVMGVKLVAEPFSESGKNAGLLCLWGKKFQLRLNVECAATHWSGNYWNILVLFKPTNNRDPTFYGFMKIWTRALFVKAKSRMF